MNENKITFYMNPLSRSRIVRWMLEELEVPYEIERLEYEKDMKSDHYLSINPMGKVPAIRHGDKIITECAAICAYLADAFPEKNLAPPISDRASYYRWMFFVAGPLEAAVTNNNLGFEVPLDKQRMAGYGSYQATIDTLAVATTQSRYIAGDTFTAADVYVGSHVGWGVQYKTLPERKEFTEYFERIRHRPAFIRADELDNAMAKS